MDNRECENSTYNVDEDNIYICRCEEVTVGDIKRAIKQGASSIKDIKLRTHACMGVCQGMTCRKNIEKILKEQKISFDLCNGHSQRFPVRLLSIDSLCVINEEGREENENDN